MKYIILFSFLLSILSCSPETKINGTYYHLKGQQKYYNLNVSVKNHRQVLIFEGVPLDLMHKLPWQKKCTGKGRGNTIKCDKIVVNFKANNQIAHVKYSDGSKQEFVSSTKEINEEIIQIK